VRRKPTTGLGTEISNTASIFFDYNEPIITNTVSLTINGQVFAEELLVNPDEITIYPNPAKSYFKFNIEQNSAVERISIYSMDGTEVLRTHQPNSNSFNIEKFQNGIYTVALFFDNTIINKKLLVFK
ncbi:MAG: T9SS type A sorting domain-containing protein, partial [Bacteroidia bacterium]|nr:T9SS type A sorting domain-containing protein [Bacteroidia bacterium]